MINRDLIFFISSTSDLQDERQAVEDGLHDLSFDGARYEAFPSMPFAPMQACLDAVRDSNAFIVILGARYGTRVDGRLSATHVEFRHAKKLGKPIFAFVLRRDEYDVDQQEFIREVEATVMRCLRVADASELRRQVMRAIAAEAARRWNVVDALPPERAMPWVPPDPVIAGLPQDAVEAKELLRRLYEQGDDRSIVAVANEAFERFRDDADVSFFVYAAEINVAMMGLPPNRSRIAEAISFLDSDSARKRWTEASRRYNQGNAYSVLGESQRAIDAFNAAVKSDQTFAQCWKNLGSELLQNDDVEGAKTAYERALEIRPDLFEALYSLGTLLYSRLNHPEAAVKTFARIRLRELPISRSTSVLGWQAIATLDTGDAAKAVALVQRALQLSHETNWLWLTAGRVYAIGRRIDKSVRADAANFWPHFVRHFPNVPGGWEELGLLLFRDRREISFREVTFRCEQALARAIELGSEDPLVWDRLGHLYEERGDWAAAESKYRFAATKDPAAHGECLVGALIHLGKYAEALPLAEAATQRLSDARNWTKLAECYQKLSRADDAEAAFEKAIDCDPDYEYAWYNLGGFYWNATRRDEALATWGEALRRFPNSPSANQVRKLTHAAGIELPER